ncbi:MAG: phospholipid carrier-dependent glycosyltransferase [Dehalococcoidia bacterium]
MTRCLGLAVGGEVQRSGEVTIAACLTVVGLGVSAVFGLLSSEGILHFDDLTHYLYANWAWQWPEYLLDEWGRPGFTALYFLPARFGWAACRGLSALLTAGSAWLAFRIAQRMGLRHAWAAVLLCYAQPLFFQLSQTTLTETPLAFYLTAGVYLAQRGRWSFSAALLSLGFVTRHEAIIFLPVWVFFAWREGVKPWRLWPILWAPLVVNALAPLAGLQPAIYRLLEPEPSGQYGHGGWLTFFCRSMEAWGPGVMVLAMVGLAAAWRKERGGRLVVTCVVTYFSVQTVIRALGLFDSGGYARFLVAVSPLVAVTALAGWQQLWAARLRRRRAAVILTAASMILLWLAMERQFVLHEARIDPAA